MKGIILFCYMPFWFFCQYPEILIQEGHFDSIRALAFSPDGKILASASRDKSIKLWDVTSGLLLRTLKSHSETVTSIAFADEGKTLVSGSDDHTLKLWDVRTGSLLRTLKGHSNSISAVSISQNSKIIASGSKDRTVNLWDARSGQLLKTLGRPFLISDVLAVSFLPDSKVLATGSGYPLVRLWDSGSGKPLRSPKFNSFSDRKLTFSADGSAVACGGFSGIVELWDIHSGALLHSLKGHSKSVSSVAFSSDGKTLASGSMDDSVKLWDVGTGLSLQTLKGHSSVVNAIAFSPDGRTLATGSMDQTIRLWDPNSGKLLNVLKRSSLEVTSVSYSPDGRMLASANYGSIKFWDAGTGQLLKTLEHSNSSPLMAVFAPDGKILGSCGLEKSVNLWDVRTGELVRNLEGHSEFITGLAISPDSQTIASGSEDGTVKLWDMVNGQLIRTLVGHSSAVFSVAFSPNGSTLASGSLEKTPEGKVFTIRLWDSASETVLFTWRDPFGKNLGSRGIFWLNLLDFEPIGTVTYSPDGSTLATASYGGNFKMWDTASGKLVRMLEPTPSLVTSVAFAPGGRTLASSGIEETIKLRDAKNGNLVKTLFGHYSDVNGVAFSPDGKTLASAGEDQKIRIWDANTGKHLMTLLAIYRTDWIAWTPEGFFDGSKGGLEKVTFRAGNKVFPYTEYAYFWGPQKLKDALGLKSPSIVGDSYSTSEKSELSFPKGNLKNLADYGLTLVREIYKGKSKTWAILIGIQNYPTNSGYGRLDFSLNDVRDLRGVLITEFGIPNDQILTFVNEQATKQHLEGFLGDELPEILDKKDRAIIYFSGHGETRTNPNGTKQGYLIPYDGKKQRLHGTCISMTQLKNISNLLPAHQVTFVVDACYSGLAGIVPKNSSKKKKVLKRISRDRLKVYLEEPARIILTAGREGDVAQMGKQWDNHSAYTYYLLKGLKGEADILEDGLITIRELQVYLETKLPETTNQQPQYFPLTVSSGQFIFFDERAIP